MKITSKFLVIILIVSAVALLGACSGTATNGTGNNAAAKTPVANAQQPVDMSKLPIGAQPPNMKGGPNAYVTIEEFADFQCPTCATVYGIMNTIHSMYGSKIKFVYRNYPLTQIHKNSYDASVAAEAAYLQDSNKFWDMQNQLFTNQKAWSDLSDPNPTFKGYAEKIGLDVAKWENDVAGLLAKNRVNADMERGRALNITGTPTIYINGKSVEFKQFNVDAIKALIDAELAKSPAAQNPPPPPAATPTANTNAKK